MTEVTEEQLLEVVRAFHQTLKVYDEDAANDAKGLVTKIKDDHPMWKKGVNEETVSKCLQIIKDSEIPPYVPPEELYPLETLWSGTSLKDLSNYENYKVVGIHHAQGGVGSKGSYILAFEIPGNTRPGLMVLKEFDLHFSAEVFASNVMRKMGLNSPKFCPLSLDEFKKFTWSLRTVPTTVLGTSGALHASGAQQLGGVLMEFLEGKVLPESDPTAFSNPKVLKELGRCMAIDMCLNCLDRTNVIWSHKGNPSNIMVFDNGLSIIDNTYNRIEHPDLQERHFGKVKECVLEAKGGKLGPHAETIRMFLSEATSDKVKLDDKQLKIVFDSLYETCVELGKNHVEIFKYCEKETRDAFMKVRSVHTKQYLDDSLKLDFCSNVAKVMLI